VRNVTNAFQPSAHPDSIDVPGWVRGRDHPLLVTWGECANLPQLAHLPDMETLEHARLQVEAVDGIGRPSFARQDAALLADGLHYEERIASFNVVATREHHAHDLFNAMMWLRHPC
jgi:hypothetical protein